MGTIPNNIPNKKPKNDIIELFKNIWTANIKRFFESKCIRRPSNSFKRIGIKSGSDKEDKYPTKIPRRKRKKRNIKSEK